MNYKTRLTLLFVGLFFVVLTAILSFIYVSYAEFRRDEFFERLKEKSFTTAKLLLEVKGIDTELLKLIDQNSINKMYDEKVLVFNDRNELIYSSLDDKKIQYSKTLLDQIRHQEDKYYVDEEGDEVVGLHYTGQGYDYVILASAYDTYGISKLKNLKELVIIALFIGTVLIALSSYFYIRQVFRPIDDLNNSIQVISENNLEEYIDVKRNRDELDKLAVNYNQMLKRLYKAFDSQRAFVRNASHELKTPLAVIQGKLERLEETGVNREEIQSLMDDVNGQAALIESLLLIQRLQSQLPINTSTVRIDEILYETVRELNITFPEQKVEIDIESSVQNEAQLTVNANVMLLKICFRNLISNAALYGDSDALNIRLANHANTLWLWFINAGDEPLPADLIFAPFYRQPKEQEKPGNGLGLSIVKQIIELSKGSVTYDYRDKNHIFGIGIPHI